MANSLICSVDGCSNPSKARGWCDKHWSRWRKFGDPEAEVRSPTPILGQKFGRLSPLLDTGKRKQGQAVWLCNCDCGNVCEVQSGNLRSGNTKSCGCLNSEKRKTSSLRHGEFKDGTQSPEWTTWWSMISRCKYPSTYAYPWYGGKGIKVCDRWLGENGFSNFLADMGRRPGKGWSIDRIDPSGDYEPSNCRWLTTSENSSRARRVKQAAERQDQIRRWKE